jgi:D-inositol-3-phosphate glycosyltransferase
LTDNTVNDRQTVITDAVSILPQPNLPPSLTEDVGVARRPMQIEVGLLTGCQDKPYALGLASALVSKGIRLDFIGGDELDSPILHGVPELRYLSLREKPRPSASWFERLLRLLAYYARLAHYVCTAQPKVLHILWNNRFEYFDRTVLMLYYKLLGKTIILTAHNVNDRKRDGSDTLLNRLTLRAQYRLCDHIFLHTEKMKSELCRDFGIASKAVTLIPFGINETVPNTELTTSEARGALGLREHQKILLFFGRIGPYKGLEFLAEAFKRLAAESSQYRLIVVGEPKKGCEAYLDDSLRAIHTSELRDRLIERIEFVPDADTEVYFKAADVLVLPYTDIFQSGLIFLAYHFGLPVIATDVGSFKEEVVEGRTGFVCAPRDPAALSETIEKYFASDLFRCLGNRRADIRDYARARHSWDAVAEITRRVYEGYQRSDT